MSDANYKMTLTAANFLTPTLSVLKDVEVGATSFSVLVSVIDEKLPFCGELSLRFPVPPYGVKFVNDFIHPDGEIPHHLRYSTAILSTLIHNLDIPMDSLIDILSDNLPYVDDNFGIDLVQHSAYRTTSIIRGQRAFLGGVWIAAGAVRDPHRIELRLNPDYKPTV